MVGNGDQSDSFYLNVIIIASHLLCSSLQIEEPVSHSLLCTNLVMALVDIK